MMTETEKKPVEDGQPVDDQQAVAVPEPEAAQEVPVKEMKAVVLTGYGGLKSVRVQKKPEPQISEGQVIIRVRAGYVPYCSFKHIVHSIFYHTLFPIKTLLQRFELFRLDDASRGDR